MKILSAIIASVLVALCNSVQAQNLNWVNQLKTTDHNRSWSIAVDGAGNVFIAGYFQGTTDFDPGAGVSNLSSVGGRDVFVAKFDAFGNLLWVVQFGDTLNDQLGGIAVDASGNVYVTGDFIGTVDFDPGVGVFNMTGSASGSLFMVQLNALGNLVWAKRIGGDAFGRSIAVDASGSIYLTGNFNGTVDFDPGPGVYNLSGTYDLFAAKFNALGGLVWAIRWGGSSIDNARSLTVDQLGNVYVTGYFRQTADFDPGPGVFNLTAPVYDDAFIIKLNASGNFVWARQMGSTSGNVSMYNSIAADASGNIYVTGQFRYSIDFDPGVGVFNVTSIGLRDAFVLKLNSSGDLIWVKQMGGSGGNYGQSIALDNSGNIFVAGYFNGITDFDPGAGILNIAAAFSDVFISKLNSFGDLMWVSQIEKTALNDNGNYIALDDSGNVVITGYFTSMTDFDPGPGTLNLTASYFDIFILKLSPAARTYYVVRGNVFEDYNSDCNWNPMERTIPGMYAKAEPGSYLGLTDGNGNYSIYLSDTGSYTISLGTPDSFWQLSCDTSYLVQLTSPLDTVSEIDFAIQQNNAGAQLPWLYGMTLERGVNGGGTIFKIRTDGSGFTILNAFDFNKRANGLTPYGDLFLANNYKLYGMTSAGGIFEHGVLFEYDLSAHTYTKLVDFNGTNGSAPLGGVVQAPNGKLYGMTAQGGSYNKGVLFEYDPSTHNYVVRFDFDSISGSSPGGSLCLASNGKLYGLTRNDGVNDNGVLFGFDTDSNVLIKKADFEELSLGRSPNGNLIEASDGMLYGMAQGGANNGYGVIFRYDPSNDSIVKLTDMAVQIHGYDPNSSFLQASNGKLYGVTSDGSNDNGVLFDYDIITGVSTQITEFGFLHTGSAAYGSVIQAANGNLYGMTRAGQMYEYDISSDTMQVVFQFNNLTGVESYGAFIEVPVITTNSSDICQGDSIYAGGDWQFATGTYYDTLVNHSGYDSIAITNLTVVNSIFTNLNPSICQNDSFLAGGSYQNIARVYYDTLTASFGCDSIIVTNLTVLDTFITNHAVSVCSGDSFFVQGSWQTASGIYADSFLTNTGCDSLVLIDLSFVSCSPVWPGDANNDGIANNFDLLNIGIGYGITGTTRPNSSTNWTAQPSPDWVDTFASGVNYKHADCNGEGIIDFNDISPIVSNYGMTHLKGSNPQRMIDPDLYFMFPKDTFQMGETVNGSVYLGTAANQITNVYGIAFSVNYPQSVIESGSFTIDFINSWMAPQNNRISLSKDLASASQLDAAVSRIDHNNASGHGKIADVSFVIRDNIDEQPLQVLFDNVSAIDKDENPVSITAGLDTLFIGDGTTSITTLAGQNRVLIYPNPASNEVIIQASFSIKQYCIRDLTGKIMLQKTGVSSQQIPINLSTIEPGVYFISVLSADQYPISKKVVVY